MARSRRQVLQKESEGKDQVATAWKFVMSVHPTESDGFTGMSAGMNSTSAEPSYPPLAL